MKKIRRKLRTKIEMSGLKRYELAAKVGISQVDLAKIISGTRVNIPCDVVCQMAKELNCNAKDLLNKRDFGRYREDLTNKGE